jgi:hypothetical protein
VWFDFLVRLSWERVPQLSFILQGTAVSRRGSSVRIYFVRSGAVGAVGVATLSLGGQRCYTNSFKGKHPHSGCLFFRIESANAVRKQQEDAQHILAF